ncbi:hypothetical protein U1Q18_051653 [Sarracenia purpurea var. burkii]
MDGSKIYDFEQEPFIPETPAGEPSIQNSFQIFDENQKQLHKPWPAGAKTGTVPTINLHEHPRLGFQSLKESEPSHRPDIWTIDHVMENLKLTQDWCDSETGKVSKRVGQVEEKTHQLAMGLQQISNNLAKTNQSNDKQHYEIGIVRGHVCDLETQIATQVVPQISTNKNDITDIKKNLEQVTEWTRSEFTQAKQAVGNVNTVVQELAGQVQELHTKLTSYNTTGTGTNTAHRGTLHCVLKQTSQITGSAMQNSGIVYTDSNRFHPHRFIKYFETYIGDTRIEEPHKCNVFRGLVLTKNSTDWREQMMEITNYEQLKKEFLEEFWDDNDQLNAFSAFKNDKMKDKKPREMAREFLKWHETLQTSEIREDLEDVVEVELAGSKKAKKSEEALKELERRNLQKATYNSFQQTTQQNKSLYNNFQHGSQKKQKFQTNGKKLAGEGTKNPDVKMAGIKIEDVGPEEEQNFPQFLENTSGNGDLTNAFEQD